MIRVYPEYRLEDEHGKCPVITLLGEGYARSCCVGVPPPAPSEVPRVRLCRDSRPYGGAGLHLPHLCGRACVVDALPAFMHRYHPNVPIVKVTDYMALRAALRQFAQATP